MRMALVLALLSMAAVPVSAEGPLDDLYLAVSVQPHIFEPTKIDVFVIDESGQPASDVARVDAQFAMRGMDHGASGIEAVQVAPGLFHAEGMLVSMQGWWYVGIR